VSTDVKFQVVSSVPTTVAVEFGGKSYLMRLALGVLNVRPAPGIKTPDGLPGFEVNAGISISVEENKVTATHG
jgi:hypothetical protein